MTGENIRIRASPKRTDGTKTRTTERVGKIEAVHEDKMYFRIEIVVQIRSNN